MTPREFVTCPISDYRARRLIAPLGRGGFSHTQPHTAASYGANATFANQFGSQILERLNDLGQRINIASYEPVAGFHALDGGQG